MPILLALLFDLLLGDPPNRFHPTAWMGSLNERLAAAPLPGRNAVRQGDAPPGGIDQLSSRSGRQSRSAAAISTLWS